MLPYARDSTVLPEASSGYRGRRELEDRIGRDRKWELRKATEPPNPPRKGRLGRVLQTLCQPWLRSQGGDGRGDVLHLSSLSFLICKLGLMTLNERGGWGACN